MEKKTQDGPTPQRRWNRAISLLGTMQKLTIREPKYGKTSENGKIVRTDSKKKHLKSLFPAEDIDLIEDCLRTALGDSRQATRILNVRIYIHPPLNANSKQVLQHRYEGKQKSIPLLQSPWMERRTL